MGTQLGYLSGTNTAQNYPLGAIINDSLMG
jgi:hypothetical protein